jgi:hypothetical protein
MPHKRYHDHALTVPKWPCSQTRWLTIQLVAQHDAQHFSRLAPSGWMDPWSLFVASFQKLGGVLHHRDAGHVTECLKNLRQCVAAGHAVRESSHGD